MIYRALTAFGTVCCLAASAPGTFEDIYGPSGASFQGAVGFRVAEGTPSTGDAQPGFGVSVDDMVVQWREYKLVEDASSCATSGSCATVSVDAPIYYHTNGVLQITVLDRSPYSLAAPVNDCNHDGDFTDAGIDDQDCDDDGIADVVVRATSLGEPTGEQVVLNRVGASDSYRGTLPISTVESGPGVLYFTDAGPNGFEITVTYQDRWDGSAAGTECRASSSPAAWGFVSTTVKVPVATAQVTVVRYRILDAPGSGTPPLPAGQDGDGFPDTNETVDMFLTVWNHTDEPLVNLVAQLATTDPKIDCILSPVAILGSLPAHTVMDFPVPVRFKVASTADRGGTVPPVSCVAGSCSNGAGTCSSASQCKKTVNDRYAATFSVRLAADRFEQTAAPQEVQVDLDLNAQTTVKATTTFAEGFEAGLANMVLMNLDDAIASNTLSNGRRCQYNDPDFVNSNSFGETECFLGFPNGGQTIVNDWHLEDSSAPDAGRAREGVRSLHYGIHAPGNPGLVTYGLSQMDAIRTKSFINLAARICRDDPAVDKRACNSASDCVVVGGGPCISANPELSFAHQISLVDDRATQIPSGQTIDRGVVQAQLFATSAVWEKLAPYQNVYDAQGSDGFTNCTFDPIDDGNTEDDYFDPSDPDRRLGPSSTCFPEFVFAYLGDTGAPFDARNIGRASEGPGLQGSIGLGTWVESKFDLSRFRGRAIRFRWLITSIKVSELPDHEALFHWNPNPGDDGWYVDDVRVTQTMGASASLVALDTVDHSALPGCGVACSSLAAALSATPSATPSPGMAVRLSTVGSLADRCVSGTLLSEFWLDGDANGSVGDPADVLLRPGAIEPFFTDAPTTTTHYGARVWCSSAPSCSSTAFALVSVGCPGTPGVFEPEAWWNRLRFTSSTTLEAPPAGQTLDAARGDLLALRGSGSFGGEVCLADGASATSLVDTIVPALGQGFYYLMRGTDAACNENRSWRTFSPKENPADPARRDTQISACSP